MGDGLDMQSPLHLQQDSAELLVKEKEAPGKPAVDELDLSFLPDELSQDHSGLASQLVVFRVQLENDLTITHKICVCFLSQRPVWVSPRTAESFWTLRIPQQEQLTPSRRRPCRSWQ